MFVKHLWDEEMTQSRSGSCPQEQGDGSEGEVPRYSIVTNELWQSNLALGLGELVSSFAESMICFLCI